MKVDLVATPFQYDTFEIVVENDARLAAPGRKSAHVTPQEVLHRLIEEELQIESSRVRQSHHEA
jgi:hypothetical protein